MPAGDADSAELSWGVLWQAVRAIVSAVTASADPRVNRVMTPIVLAAFHGLAGKRSQGGSRLAVPYPDNAKGPGRRTARGPS
ncbi:hypothetical protein GCM10023194_76570 [Planotetraspora phitsanulokensis]|uniref:Uncharacterized protein n=1 Tax=Planotetraspora phitsanulokensis TaxID=575192 RepID=A0A8J3TZJ5_9ACTN|nr:hypothetical protein Pph01_04740 [Planotetraspora phitsanulokensis]